MIVPRMLLRSVERTPERDALVNIETGRRYTYRELQTEVHRIANALRERGVSNGDRVAIAMRNSAEHVLLNLATQYAGAVAVPFNHRSAPETVAYHLGDADPALFAYDDALRETVEDAHDDLPCEVFVDAGEGESTVGDDFASLRDAPADRPEVDVDPDDPSVILYTSGTTGRPKGVPLSHRSAVLRAIDTSLAQHSYVEGDVTLSTMPLYHTIGLHSNCLSRFALSGTFVPMPEFDPGRYLEIIDRESVSLIFTAPTVLNQLVGHDRIGDADLSSVRVLGYGGSPISEHVVERAREHLAPDRMINIYGSTETYHPLALVDPTDSGRNGAFYRRRIVELGTDDPTAEVDVGETGELIVDTNSPIVFDAYWQKPAETDAAIHDGWFFSGDTAYETSDGRTVISGRASTTSSTTPSRGRRPGNSTASAPGDSTRTSESALSGIRRSAGRFAGRRSNRGRVRGSRTQNIVKKYLMRELYDHALLSSTAFRVCLGRRNRVLGPCREPSTPRGFV
ncbi:MAG: class I adenylate-forming enzyme family protein [Halarchaeum sp.]